MRWNNNNPSIPLSATATVSLCSYCRLPWALMWIAKPPFAAKILHRVDKWELHQHNYNLLPLVVGISSGIQLRQQRVSKSETFFCTSDQTLAFPTEMDLRRNLSCVVEAQITPPAQDGTEGNVRLLLTKHPTRSFSCPRCQLRGISFERFPQPGRTLKLMNGFVWNISLW